MKPVSVILLVSHLSASGELVKAPPARMPTMEACKEAKAEVEKGFRGDAVHTYKVLCVQEKWAPEMPK